MGKITLKKDQLKRQRILILLSKLVKLFSGWHSSSWSSVCPSIGATRTTLCGSPCCMGESTRCSCRCCRRGWLTCCSSWSRPPFSTCWSRPTFCSFCSNSPCWCCPSWEVSSSCWRWSRRCSCCSSWSGSAFCWEDVFRGTCLSRWNPTLKL